MQIIGPDEVVFGVDDVAACATYLTDFGLTRVAPDLFEALDGTAIRIRPRDDASLPPPLPTATMLRKSVYGVTDATALAEIRAELETDRTVTDTPDGGFETVDDSGFVLGFRVTTRRVLDLPGERVNSPGAAPQRLEDEVAANEDVPALPRTLSHIVYFVPNLKQAEAFYVERLKFRVTDRFEDAGPFLRPGACRDHHTLFLIQTPEYMQGLEHIAFHMQGPTELMLAGTRMVNKGYESFWGPGRHKFGSNWFWYFNSPMATHMEYDADMDLHSDDWVPRSAHTGPTHSQMFLFRSTPKWAPGPDADDH
ncbi:VOC family protein [Pseudooceanicola sp. CBS1P-1]|uniref:Glyoxalase n=1 Tax=Pseudooceanicola albus TaxID=2692189 RepID=A0A6L7GAH3_9RHOB|nr:MULTISPECIES: VOC family protein [Pseudooceanicola]MBT9386793.1 VOC family protein [Pseudooceanicola endophyticus]MXN20949.1 glyoxalase [Pseudooceanicola albus]